jgi:hypothetical protein
VPPPLHTIPHFNMKVLLPILTFAVALTTAFDIPHTDVGPEDYQEAFGYDDPKYNDRKFEKKELKRDVVKRDIPFEHTPGSQCYSVKPLHPPPGPAGWTTICWLDYHSGELVCTHCIFPMYYTAATISTKHYTG